MFDTSAFSVKLWGRPTAANFCSMLRESWSTSSRLRPNFRMYISTLDDGVSDALGFSW